MCMETSRLLFRPVRPTKPPTGTRKRIGKLLDDVLPRSEPNSRISRRYPVIIAHIIILFSRRSLMEERSENRAKIAGSTKLCLFKSCK